MLSEQGKRRRGRGPEITRVFRIKLILIGWTTTSKESHWDKAWTRMAKSAQKPSMSICFSALNTKKQAIWILTTGFSMVFVSNLSQSMPFSLMLVFDPTMMPFSRCTDRWKSTQILVAHAVTSDSLKNWFRMKMLLKTKNWIVWPVVSGIFSIFKDYSKLKLTMTISLKNPSKAFLGSYMLSLVSSQATIWMPSGHLVVKMSSSESISGQLTKKFKPTKSFPVISLLVA